jgi:hypothetical protein
MGEFGVARVTAILARFFANRSVPARVLLSDQRCRSEQRGSSATQDSAMDR